jgi:hypothetical protein
MTDTDWRERIDSSFGAGPDLPSATERVTAGRAALRRRRAGLAASTVAAAMVAGAATSWLVAGDAWFGADPPAVTTSAPEPTPVDDPNDVPHVDHTTTSDWFPSMTFEPGSSQLQPPDGVEILEQVADPHLTDDGRFDDTVHRSVAAVVRADGAIWELFIAESYDGEGYKTIGGGKPGGHPWAMDSLVEMSLGGLERYLDRFPEAMR